MTFIPTGRCASRDDYPHVHSIIEAVEACATENEAAYVCFMAVRLIECHRVLKPTGSIYVHCDDRGQQLPAAASGRPVWDCEPPQ